MPGSPLVPRGVYGERLLQRDPRRVAQAFVDVIERLDSISTEILVEIRHIILDVAANHDEGRAALLHAPPCESGFRIFQVGGGVGRVEQRRFGRR
jgi:hypothetical protein